MEPNEQQQELIDSIDGIYLVDAGAGTGKTFALTRRYAYILRERDADPDDLLLVTFTNNAAEEMKKKVITLCENYSTSELRDAPICTFHSLCNRIVKTHGFEAPELLDIHDKITSSTDIIENEILEKQEFRMFMNRFIEDNQKYVDYYRIIYDYSNLLNLIKKISSKGVFPTKDGWYQNGEKYLDGDFEKFDMLFDEANETENDGNRQSELRSRLSEYKNKCFPNGAPEQIEIRGSGSKQIPKEIGEKAFNEDREDLKKFVHDVYHGYIKYALNRNYLNFNFLLMFAYVLLCENHNLREDLRYKYVMIDEFQDTSEIQLKIALLLSKSANICAVGDWKQSIYSFQYADVDNIREFKNRLMIYRRELNEDYSRIGYEVKDIKNIPLKVNYRSSQDILDFSEQSLSLKATKRENLDKEEIMEDVTSLESSKKMKGPTEIEAFVSEDEKEAVLGKIQEIVGNKKYLIGENGDFREPTYSDIVILTRTSKFGLELQKKSREYEIPLVYEGGTEIFKTNPSIILLAWLRILDWKHSKRGWAVVLEETGYNLDETEYILKNRDYPKNIIEFRENLKSLDSISAIARKVFNRYGIANAFADKIIEVLQKTFESTYMNTGRIVQFIEENIEENNRYEVDNSQSGDVVKVRTIHAEKGLEHPIVFISDINSSRFPGSGRGGSRIDYRDPIGLRQKKIYRDDNEPYVYDNWRTEVLNKCLSGKYDEERRLMYVAMTRAKRYLFLSSEIDRSSPLFENLDIKVIEEEPELEKVKLTEKKRKKFKIGKPSHKTPIKVKVSSLTKVKGGSGKGEEFGTKVHLFAERCALGEDIEPSNIDEANVKEFLDDLEGDLSVEETCMLPLEVDDRQVVLKGSIDLIHINGNKVDVFDYKTDRNRTNESEYKKQLSAYYYPVNDFYKGKKVSTKIFYTDKGEISEIKPISRRKLKKELQNIF